MCYLFLKLYFSVEEFKRILSMLKCIKILPFTLTKHFNIQWITRISIDLENFHKIFWIVTPCLLWYNLRVLFKLILIFIIISNYFKNRCEKLKKIMYIQNIHTNLYWLFIG